MEHYSFYDSKWNWSEEILATAIVASAGLNLWSLFAPPSTDSTIALLMGGVAVGLLIYCIFIFTGNIDATPSVSFFLFVMLLSMATNAINIYGCATSQKTLGR